MAEYDNPELLPLNSRLNTPTFQSLAQARGTDPYNRLGSELGSALFGGGARDARAEQVFNQSAKNSATIADVMMQARQRRDMEIGRQALASSLEAKGDNDGAAIVRNSKDAHEAQEALLSRNQLQAIQGLPDVMGKVGYTPQAANLYGGLAAASKGANLEGDTKAFASLATPYAGTPAVGLDSTKLAHVFNPDATKVAGGLIYDEGAPASQALIQTPEGKASVNEKNTAATRNLAQAAKAGQAGEASTFAADEGDLLAAMAERGVSIPAGLRSKQQIHTTLQSLISRNPDKGPDDIADMIRSGQLDLAGSKKETTTAAGVAGRVAIAQNELGTFAPLVRQASAAVPRGSFMPVNKLMQMANTQISDPKLLQLKIGINSMLNAYDMLAARGGTDVAKRAEAHSLLTSAQSPEALEAGIQMFEREATAAGAAADKAMHRGGGSLGAVMQTPDAPAVETKVIGGKPYVNHNGQWYEQ